MATTGTNLTTWQSSTNWFFDPTNEVPIVINTTQYLYIATTGIGATYNVGYYSIGSPQLAYNASGTNADTHNIFQVTPINANGTADSSRTSALVSTTLANPPQHGATWGYGTTTAAAFAAVPTASSITGVTITPSTASVTTGTQQFSAVVNGTGSPSQIVTWSTTLGTISASGLYTPPAQTASSQTATITATASDGTHTGTSTLTVSGTASYTPPTVTPNTALTSALSGVLIGDSRTQYNGNYLTTRLRTNFPNSVVTVYNAGQPGDTLEMYATGDASGRLTAIINYLNTVVSGGCNFAQICLGTNDKKNTVAPTAASFKAQMQALINSLFGNCSALKAIVVEEIPYTVPGSGGGLFDANSDALGQAYNAALGTLSYVTVGRGEYAATSTYPNLTSGDGVHPSTTAAANGSLPGSGPGYDAQTGIWAYNLQSVLSSLPASAPTVTPGAPTISTTLTGYNQNTVSWTPGIGVTNSYNVKRSLSAGGPFTNLAAGTGITGTTFTDNTAVNGTSYFYQTSGVNLNGEGTVSTTTAGLVPALAVGPPTAPVIAIVAGQGIKVTWTNGNGTGGGYSGINVYRIPQTTTHNGVPQRQDPTPFANFPGNIISFIDRLVGTGLLNQAGSNSFSYFVTGIINGVETAPSAIIGPIAFTG